MKTKWRRYKLYIISFVSMLLVMISFASPSQAHWADLAVAEINIGDIQTAITLTLPTGLVALADDNRWKNYHSGSRKTSSRTSKLLALARSVYRYN